MPKFYEWNIEQNGFKSVNTDKLEELYDGFCQKRLDCNNSLIGLCFQKSTKLALLMNSVRNSKNAFCWLDSNADSQFIKSRCLRMRVKIVLSDQQLEWPSTSWTLDEETRFWIVNLPYSDSLDVFGSQFVYSICTSGSTGDPKTVHVPESAIMPNVHDFIDRFKLTVESRLMWSTSLDFDPSFLELLMAFELDCLFYIVEDVDLKQIWKFAKMISMARPNFLQITPAVLSLFSNEFLFELLGPNSSVEYLLIGGDTFPTAFILRYVRDCSAYIYNVYGLTEVSCWASCTRFDPKVDTIADSSNAIQDTRLFFGPDGVEIYGRSCVVNGEKRTSIQTDDQFICLNVDGKDKYVITSREKINGTIVTREVEQFLMENFDFVDTSRLVTYKQQLFVFVKRIDRSSNKVVVPDKFNIKAVFYVDKFSITPNGKIDDKALRLHIQQDEKLRKFNGTVVEYLQSNLDLKNSSTTTIASLGFSSRDLFEFIFEVTQHNKKLDNEKTEEIRQRLFDEKTPTNYLFELIAECKLNDSIDEPDNDIVNDFIELQNVDKPKQYSIGLKSKFPMKKCADHSAEFYNRMIFVGDMSGYFAIFNAETKQLVAENQHDSAVVTKCLIHSGKAVYCTADGQVHLIDLNSFNTISLLIGPSIRADPCLFDEARIFVATFSTHVSLLDLSTNESEIVCELSSGPIRNPPLIIDEFVIVSTVDGVLAGFRKGSLTSFKWRRRLHKFVFAPLFQLSTTLFGVSTLDGNLHFMAVADGQITRTFGSSTSYSVQPTILPSSYIVIPSGKDLIKMFNQTSNDIQEETYKLPGLYHQSRIVYSSLLGMPLIKCTNTDDSTCKLMALDFGKRTMETILKLDAPSFGDPLIIEENDQIEHLIIGARDNAVYSFELIKTG